MCIKASSNSLPTVSAFNQKLAKKAQYQIQRCAYTKPHSTRSSGLELAKGLKPRGQGIKFVTELEPWGQGINFSRRRRKCPEIPLPHAPGRGFCSSPFFPTLLFFQANIGTDRIKAPGVTFQSDYIGPFTYRIFPRPKIKESTVLSMKTFPLQTSPLHRTTIPVSSQVLTWTQVTTDTPKSVPFFPHQVWMRKTTLVCHFSLGPSLPLVLLILCRDEISRIHTKHTKNELCQCNHWKEKASWILFLREFSTAIWYFLYFLNPCRFVKWDTLLFEISLLHSVLSAWLRDSCVCTDYEKVGVCPFCGNSVHQIFQWKMGKIKAEANRTTAMKWAQSAFIYIFKCLQYSLLKDFDNIILQKSVFTLHK